MTAAAQPGYVLAVGAPTTWTFDLTPTPVAEMPVALPEQIAAFPLFAPEDPAELRLVVFGSEVFADLAAEGVPYELVTASEVVVSYDVIGPGEGASSTDTATIPWSASLVYDAATEQLVLTIVDGAAFQEQFAVAEAEVEARHPGAEVYQSGFPELGLALVTTFEPGPGCAAEVTTVPIAVAPPV